MNYGEEIAYWYFRLNGFFPLANFVVHRGDNNQYDRDCDILAVRPPLVHEDIGGRFEDWDQALSGKFLFLSQARRTQFTGVICEVKTGRIDNNFEFHLEVLSATIHRLGLTGNNAHGRVLRSLREEGDFVNGACQIRTVLISSRQVEGPWVNVLLSDAVSFLRARFRNHYNAKNAARMFFNNNFIQMLADDNVNGK